MISSLLTKLFVESYIYVVFLEQSEVQIRVGFKSRFYNEETEA